MKNLFHFFSKGYIMKSSTDKFTGLKMEAGMEFPRDDLTEAKKQIDSTLHKLKETIKTFESKENAERYKSQITLAKRRIKAFEIANYFIESELESKV